MKENITLLTMMTPPARSRRRVSVLAEVARSLLSPELGAWGGRLPSGELLMGRSFAVAPARPPPGTASRRGVPFQRGRASRRPPTRLAVGQGLKVPRPAAAGLSPEAGAGPARWFPRSHAWGRGIR